MIRKMGVEIECGFAEATKKILQDGFWSRKSDGSVDTEKMGVDPMEFVSRPYGVDKGEWEEFKRNLRILYRRVKEMNGSMGLHFHVSVDEPMLYCSKKFEDYVVAQLKKKPAYRSNELIRLRVAGQSVWHGSRYTAPTPVDTLIANCSNGQNGRHASRYHHVNHCAYYVHGTIEIRIFPGMATSAEVVWAAGFVKSVFESYAKRLKGRVIKLAKTALEVDEEE
jgi:hypothetical protein